MRYFTTALSLSAVGFSAFLTARPAQAQFTDGTAILNASVTGNVNVLIPAQANGTMTANGTITIKRTNAGPGSVKLLVTQMNLTGNIAASGLPPITLTLVADLTNAQRSNNAGQMAGAGFPANTLFDIFFKATATAAGLGTLTGYSALNQDHGLDPEPIHLSGTASDGLGNGSYTMMQTAGGHDGNPTHTGFLFITANPDGSGISYIEILSANMVLSGGTPVAQPPVLMSAASRYTQAGVDFDIAAPLTGAVTESRVGASPKVVMTFAEAPGSLTCANFTVSSTPVGTPTCSSVAVSGNSAVLTLAGVANNTCLTVSAGGVPDITGDANVAIRVHQGNVNGDAGVNVSDLQAIKNALLVPVQASNFMNDVNADGSINVSDLVATKNNLLIAAACPN